MAGTASCLELDEFHGGHCEKSSRVHVAGANFWWSSGRSRCHMTVYKVRIHNTTAGQWKLRVGTPSTAGMQLHEVKQTADLDSARYLHITRTTANRIAIANLFWAGDGINLAISMLPAGQSRRCPAHVLHTWTRASQCTYE